MFPQRCLSFLLLSRSMTILQSLPLSSLSLSHHELCLKFKHSSRPAGTASCRLAFVLKSTEKATNLTPLLISWRREERGDYCIMYSSGLSCRDEVFSKRDLRFAQNMVHSRIAGRCMELFWNTICSVALKQYEASVVFFFSHVPGRSHWDYMGESLGELLP